jgi:hypothetical protein
MVFGSADEGVKESFVLVCIVPCAAKVAGSEQWSDG